MAMDEGVTDILKKESIVQHSSTASSTNDSPSQAKILNLRQRKWNSVSKEWQEWHDVQATHAPDLPSPPSQQTQSQSQLQPPAAAAAISRASATEIIVSNRPTNGNQCMSFYKNVARIRPLLDREHDLSARPTSTHIPNTKIINSNSNNSNIQINNSSSSNNTSHNNKGISYRRRRPISPHSGGTMMFQGQQTNSININVMIHTLGSLFKKRSIQDTLPVITATTSTRTMAMHGQVMEQLITHHLDLVIHLGCVILCLALRPQRIHSPPGWI
ncbi:hypothetical protein BGZ96_011177 [Linnemannia gamsii]|uniref:Uncharacterized protein n=1 Tax=Linnemannia gamsii TaxID=64522 RepID=A0ABQ7KDD7_9FUNG|nr:hypothetical protein BGZ96_011177 [Linnemannia gamsii]